MKGRNELKDSQRIKRQYGKRGSRKLARPAVSTPDFRRVGPVSVFEPGMVGQKAKGQSVILSISECVNPK